MAKETIPSINRKLELFDELVEACAEAWATLKVYKYKTPIVDKLDGILTKAREVYRFDAQYSDR